MEIDEQVVHVKWTDGHISKYTHDFLWQRNITRYFYSGDVNPFYFGDVNPFYFVNVNNFYFGGGGGINS